MPSARTVLALALALAALPALAGCVGTAQATAMDSLSPADEAAKAWDPGAQLAQAVGVEGSSFLSSFIAGGALARGGDFDRAGDDETVGDGRCEVWVFRYVAEGRSEAYVVVVDRDENILREGPEAKGSDDRALGAWEVDSDEALEIALAENGGLREGTEREHFGIVSILHKQGPADNPVWRIAGGGGDATGGGGGMVLVDAVTGEVLSSEGGYSFA